MADLPAAQAAHMDAFVKDGTYICTYAYESTICAHHVFKALRLNHTCFCICVCDCVCTCICIKGVSCELNVKTPQGHIYCKLANIANANKPALRLAEQARALDTTST